MAKLSLQQITEKLNRDFSAEGRRLVFWYDTNAEFLDDIDSFELENAKVLILGKNNQFFIKHFLECEDTATNYLVYAPFAKPLIQNNHLEDMILYSEEFFADRASMIAHDLDIQKQYEPIIQQYIKFFASKERLQAFSNLKSEQQWQYCNKKTIEVGLMTVLSGTKYARFDEVVLKVFSSGLENNAILAEFEKYNLVSAFWQYVKDEMGYSDPNPSLCGLARTMLVTYMNETICSIPNDWKAYVSSKSGNIITFLDKMMNGKQSSNTYDELAEYVSVLINCAGFLENVAIDSIVDCQLFPEVDCKILTWMTDCLERDDTSTKVAGRIIPELCADRKKKHFGERYNNDYSLIENAYHIINGGIYQFAEDSKSIADYYQKLGFDFDRNYRRFYYYYDRLNDNTEYETLRDYVEKFYTNDYLNKIIINWNQTMANGNTGLPLQRNFFREFVKVAKERTVVIISDALRYEVAVSLLDKFLVNEKTSSTSKIKILEGVLPSYTPLGMAALLPHERLEYSKEYAVLVDGKPCVTTNDRQTILQSHSNKSCCLQFDKLKNMKQEELRSIFTGQGVIYIYHNQIDARGESSATENEVFNACQEAIDEIYKMVLRISSLANTHNFLITADHGFIYKRDRLSASDKISGVSTISSHIGSRFLLTEKKLEINGVCSATIGAVLGSRDARIVAFPLASDIFSTSGSGQNYVHGGSSPQEMLVPLLQVKVEKGRKDTAKVNIDLAIPVNTITNLSIVLQFVQKEPVSDIVKERSFNIYFISEDGSKVSNENMYVANKTDLDTSKRFFTLPFKFKEQKYQRTSKYYLVVLDHENKIEVMRKEYMIDIPFADDFGFSV